MLKIRLARTGRKGLPLYRIVLTEHRAASQHGYLKVLGTYNPRTKDLVLDRVAADQYVAHGAQYSDTLKKILERPTTATK